ncbi:MAG: DUF2061 domain-containing protein [Candidatus Thorarchaeota archaeon]
MATVELEECKHRSVVKTFSWRILVTASIMTVIFLVTGRLDFTLGVGIADIGIRMPLYFLHERIWNKVNFGKQGSEKART